MDNKTAEILERCTSIAKKRADEKKALEAELAPPVTDLDTPSRQIQKGRGFTSDQIAEFQRLDIVRKEQDGMFQTFPVSKINISPTLISRIPIFAAMDVDKQEAFYSAAKGWAFDTPWGTGSRHGALLDMWDKSVFLAICRLREKRIRGDGGKLPIPIRNIFRHDTEIFKLSRAEKNDIDVDIVVCTATDILVEMDLSKAGKHYERVKEALVKLNRTVVELTTTNSRYTCGMENGERGFTFKLLDMQWIVNKKDHSGVYYIQLSPVTTRWLESDYTYVVWDVRKQIADNFNAVALFDFLSTQPATFEWDMLAVARAIGLDTSSPKRVRQYLTRGCKALVDIQWLVDFDFTGSGRRTPLKLHTWRATNPK
jgi:hypothetical protein